MKIQNTVTLKQAQQLDKAINEAGLEWPGIEWKRGYGGNKDGKFSATLYEWSVIVQSAMQNKQISGIPAPNLAELITMIPGEYPMPQIDDNGTWNANLLDLGNGTFLEAIINYVLCLTYFEWDDLKAHWEKLNTT